jgi:hypothetical protein
MTRTRIRSLTVKGFRAYGPAEQTLNVPAELAAVWGPNSKGKTSLAEAFEFLLTGKVVRRELMASAQDEFADALRNAHLATTDEVFVAAKIEAPDGAFHEIKRLLTADYGKRQDCTSRLEIDGAPAAEADLAKLGIVLSQPPLQAPVLAQHTLGHIFSVRPQDRATYFKTLLEVTDLDDLRNEIAALTGELAPFDDPLLGKFDRCLTVAALKPVLSGLATSVPSLARLIASMERAARALIEAAGEDDPPTPEERLQAIEKILADRRGKTFPVRAFARANLTGWNPPSPETWAALGTYLVERAKVDEETRRLTSLFDEALKIPAIDGITDLIACPLCGTDSALTPERVHIIRRHVEDTKGFATAEAIASQTLHHLSASANALVDSADAGLPSFLKENSIGRRAAGFTLARIRLLLGERADDVVLPWLACIRPLVRASAALRRGARSARQLAAAPIDSLATAQDIEHLAAAFASLTTLHARFAGAISAYAPTDAALQAALNEVLDAQSDTAGWQDFLDIAAQPAQLRAALIERAARGAVAGDLDAALKQIDRAKEHVLDDKFADYSTLIQNWWERLRPDEPTFFSAVQPRKGAKRTIDFKAGLSANPDRSAPKVRDVIAVFSQSQLHCLGLALFLARAEHEKQGFVVLDDPVLSSDEDYRVHFDTTVLTELINLPMQVIVLTQDHTTWKEMEARYRHRGIATAQLFVETPAAGTIIENTSDDLLAKINRAKSLARGGHPDSRKECGVQLRDAGERFCKEMLVNDRRGKGDAAASLADYDGKVLEWLCPHVDPLLARDPSHPGKLEAFRNAVNRACHDNTPPGNAEMTHACGEIRYLVKEYLGR